MGSRKSQEPITSKVVGSQTGAPLNSPRWAAESHMHFNRLLCSLIFALFLAGCARGPTEMQLCKFSYLGVYHIPPTARKIEAFRKITPTMGMEHIAKIVGYPDALWGSGLYIYAYHL